MALEDIRSERIKKLEKLRQNNLNPYPARTRRTHLIGEVLKKFGTFAKLKKKISVAGRVVARREHGGSTFLDLRDVSGTIQLYFKKDVLGEAYDSFLGTVDVGDFLEAEGKCFKTKRGEGTIEVTHWAMLAKSLRPLPEKWHGLQDVEERFRKRYLDLLANDAVRANFVLRSRIIKSLRDFLEKSGFLEVETPMLHPIPGGALAKPFKTRHNALDTDFYLRIAPELYLKRLLVGGFERVYEMGKIFRNEGIDATHNPEFTMAELYAAYWDEEDMMNFVEGVFLNFAKAFGKKGETEYQGKKIKFKKPFLRVTFRDLLSRYAQITDYEGTSRDALATRARQLGIEISSAEPKDKIADEIYKKICRPYLIQPTFVINHPRDISPLAKSRDENPQEARRLQLVAAGMELANGFSELNDPLEQRKRFGEQEKIRGGGESPRLESGRASPGTGGGDEEAHRMDEDYLEALEYGMPPAAGLGVGVDRVVILFTDTKNVREVMLFPTMRIRKEN